ncbi:MAG: hypothetical protein CV087_21070 [Candidatus Brocadia sp. WS118]|nr:MAG: hypothetical protein CV087_21070 [Candidatus Brocadia sp. WS118]
MPAKSHNHKSTLLVTIIILILSSNLVTINRLPGQTAIPGGGGGAPSDYLSSKRDSTDNLISIERRVAVLESTKADLEVWVTIFVTIVTLLIALNIGLSVWQVGSIARREVESSIKEYDEKFQGVLSSGAKAIDEKFSSYEEKLKLINHKLTDLQPKLQNDLDTISKKLTEVKSEADNLLSKFKTDSESIKKNILSEIENYYLKQIQSLDSKK